MRKIRAVFVRHGASKANEMGQMAGKTDVELAGKAEKELLELKKEIDYPTTDLYFSSTLKRAKATAKILYGDDVNLRCMADFAEIDFGELEGIYFWQADLDQVFANWYDKKVEYGMEEFDIFTARVDRGLKELLDIVVAEDASSFTLVSHSCVMRQIRHGMESLDKEEFLNYRKKNGRGFIAELIYNEDTRIIVVEKLIEF